MFATAKDLKLYELVRILVIPITRIRTAPVQTRKSPLQSGSIRPKTGGSFRVKTDTHRVYIIHSVEHLKWISDNCVTGEALSFYE